MNKLGVIFYDWNTRKNRDDTSLMYNYIHLNKAGAAVLANMLCTDNTFRALVTTG